MMAVLYVLTDTTIEPASKKKNKRPDECSCVECQRESRVEHVHLILNT